MQRFPVEASSSVANEEKKQKVWRKLICIQKKFLSVFDNIRLRIVMANDVGCYIAGTF